MQMEVIESLECQLELYKTVFFLYFSLKFSTIKLCDFLLLEKIHRFEDSSSDTPLLAT